VVEAAVRSGALNTANWTTRLNRVLMGVPGPVTSAPSEGVHELIRTRDAALVTRGADVLELVAPVGSFLPGERRGKDRPRDGLTEKEMRVIEAVPVRTAVPVASIARTAGLAERDVTTALTLLKDKRLVEESAGTWRLAATAL
jgi:DNA processing protein